MNKLFELPYIKELLSRCDFPAPGTPVTVGVSGGADSVALLILAVGAGCEATAVHVNHGIRPDTENEADFVRQIADDLGAGFRSETTSVASGGNLEARARSARYNILGPKALIGHTADDQAETILANLMRGAGLDGMAGMRQDGRRPLLRLRRSETEQVCVLFGYEPFADPMNTDPRYRRVRIRQELVGLMGDIAQRDIVDVICRQAENFSEISKYLESQGNNVDPTDVKSLRTVDPVVAKVVLRNWIKEGNPEKHPPDAQALARAMEVVAGKTPRTDLGWGRRLERSRGKLTIVDI